MRHLRGSQWINFPRVSNETWVNGQCRADGRRRAYRAFLHRLRAPSSRWRTRSRSPARIGKHRRDLRAGARRLRGRAPRRGAALQSAARNSTEWFENVARYAQLGAASSSPIRLLTRSQRVSHENLRLRDRPGSKAMERWLGARASGGTPNRPVPPMFLPFRLRDMTLANRVVVSPMAMYSAHGRHAQRLPPRASRRARAGRRRPGVHRDDLRHAAGPHHARLLPACGTTRRCAAWQRIVDFVHASRARRSACSSAIPARRARRSSAGKAWTSRSTAEQLASDRALAVPWSPHNQVPRAMTRADMDAVRDAFVRADAARRTAPASTCSSCTRRTATCCRRSSRR